MKITVKYQPKIARVKLFWFKAERPGVYGIAEWKEDDAR